MTSLYLQNLGRLLSQLLTLEWYQRRWYEFRLGNIYIGTIQSLASFTIIAYVLVIEKLNIKIFDTFLKFVIIFSIIYFPARTIAGHIHRTRQMKFDTGMAAEQNPVITEILDRLERIESKLEEK